MSSLRTRILIISSATVIGALALSGAATYSIVRSNTMAGIDQNLAAVASGNTLAINKWVAAKAQAVAGIERVARIIGEIDGAMHEQSAGISQIDRSVAEMDQATQQNAALVEQSTAASSMLNEQAHSLARTVGLFKLRAG